MEINDNTPIYCLTVKQFKEMFNEHISQQILPVETKKEETKLLKGIKELAEFLGMSISSAQRLKATGFLIPATMQTGRTCLFDADKVLELIQSRQAVLHYKKRKK